MEGSGCAAPSCGARYTGEFPASQPEVRQQGNIGASPDFTASKHARVHDVGADQRGLDAVQVLRQQLVRQ